jgi:adenylate cyclase
VLYVDVRGATPLAESMPAADFSRLLNKFYSSVTAVLIRSDAYIDKFVGDEVMAIYLPLFAGGNPGLNAVTAAADILEATGHTDETGPWLPVGIGVHTGQAFFGTVTGAEGVFADFTALGDPVNVGARLVAAAQPGEALISDATCQAAGLSFSGLEHRDLRVKGKTEPIGVRVLRVSPDVAGERLDAKSHPDA